MKRFFIFILTLFLFFSLTSTPLIAEAVVDETLNGATADAFAQDLGELMQEEYPSFKTEYHNDCKFSTCRLIVKSEGIIDTLDALSVINGFEGLWILQFENCSKTEEAYNYYSTRNDISFVEIDAPISSSASTTSSVSEPLSWGPEYINITQFNHDISKVNFEPKETVVAVVDTGVEDTHVFFNGKVIPTNVNTSGSGTRNSSKDDNGHGTQVAGVIADSTADCVKIKPYKVLNNYGNGTAATVAAGIICAVYDEVDIINISLGFYENSPVLELAVKKAYDNDIVLVAAAGNDATDTPFYPASYPEVLKVTAINKDNVIANFCNYGDDVDYAAPGVDIYTTHLYNSYMKISGTSIAAPFVSALAASVKSYTPDGSAEDIIKVIENNALIPPNIADNTKYGHGIISAPEVPENSSNINGKTEKPYFSHDIAIYTDSFNLEIICDTPNSEIYYSTNGNFPSKYSDDSIKYEGPIAVEENIILTAVAYSEGKFRSKFATFMAIVAKEPDESHLEINDSGKITAYTGSSDSISIPETVKGITVTGIGANAFAGSDIVCVTLPKTATSIDASAFEECSSLRTIIGTSVTDIGERAFYNCSAFNYIYLGELKTIGEYSFYNVCSETNSITGETFSLDLLSLTSIPEGAFNKSAISEIRLGKIGTISKNAFNDCNQLINVHIEQVTSIPNSMFTGCTSLRDVEIFGLSFVSRSAFSGCSSLVNVNIPDATMVNSLAFEKCTSLTDVNLKSATLVYSNAFSGCTSLKLLSLPEFNSFQVNSTANGAYPAFPPNLETFYAPKLTKTVPNMFASCPNIKNILLNGATDLVALTFNECKNLVYLDIESVKEITEDAFVNASVKFVDARQLVRADYLPENSGILLTNTFVEATSHPENVTLYAPSGSVVEEYAIQNGYKFVPIPFVATELPHCVNDNSETIGFIPVGFNLEMQWYYNSEPSVENSTLLEGATTSSFTFTEDYPDGYYYCEIKQNYEGTVSTAYTSFVLKDTVHADYSKYNIAVEQAKILNKSIYKDFSEVEAALAVDVSGLYSHQQDVVDAQTQAIYTAIKNLDLKKVTNFRIYARKTQLKVMQTTKLYVGIGPENASYSSITYSVNNPDVIKISKTGYVRCVGAGTATVTATLTNHDGSVLTAKLTFTCKTSPMSAIFSLLFKLVLLLVSPRYFS